MIIPLFFDKEPIPQITNQKLKAAIELVRMAHSKKDALRIAFGIIDEKFQGLRYRTYTLFWHSFETNPNKLWQRSGFLHCTQQNYLLRVLLIKSGWFKEEEIDLGYSMVWYISPHQYLKVKIDGNWIAVDPWNMDYGAKIGLYASGFGFKRL